LRDLRQARDRPREHGQQPGHHSQREQQGTDQHARHNPRVPFQPRLNLAGARYQQHGSDPFSGKPDRLEQQKGAVFEVASVVSRAGRSRRRFRSRLLVESERIPGAVVHHGAQDPRIAMQSCQRFTRRLPVPEAQSRGAAARDDLGKSRHLRRGRTAILIRLIAEKSCARQHQRRRGDPQDQRRKLGTNGRVSECLRDSPAGRHRSGRRVHASGSPQTRNHSHEPGTASAVHSPELISSRRKSPILTTQKDSLSSGVITPTIEKEIRTIRTQMRWPGVLLLLITASLGLPASDPQEPTPSGTQAKKLASLELETLLNMEVTTASKFPQKLADAPGVISVVTKDELRRFGGITLGEILERVPGLQRASAYFTDRSLIAARGDQTKIDGGHILILVDGRPAREILEGGLVSDLLESFPVSVLERIEVIRGPGSVLYGSNAFSAVINLIPIKAQASTVDANGLGGPDGTAATSATVTAKRGELGITAAGQFHQDPTWYVPYRSPFYPVQT